MLKRVYIIAFTALLCSIFSSGAFAQQASQPGVIEVNASSVHASLQSAQLPLAPSKKGLLTTVTIMNPNYSKVASQNIKRSDKHITGEQTPVVSQHVKVISLEAKSPGPAAVK